MIDTISYSPGSRGWVSRATWYPDLMIGMNSTLYSFKNGNLYKHYANASYNEFYGESTDEGTNKHPTSVTFPFNEAPDEEKVFKTLSIDSNIPWIVDVSTELSNGNIDDSYFQLKEGEYHAWIRRDSGELDLENLSIQGVGQVASYSAGPPIVLTFGFNITTPIANGDKLYRVDATGTGIELIGNVTAHTATTITVDAAAVTPAAPDMILIAKDSTAESRGARGSYMLTEMKVYKDTAVEMFGAGSEVFKSNP